MGAEGDQRAGFVVRTLAYLVDTIVFGLPVLLLERVLGLSWAGSQLLAFVAGSAYFTWFWSTQGGGQTLGMKVFGLRVVGPDGQALPPARAFLRWIGLAVSFAVLALGVLVILVDPQKQGWHDRLVGSVVLRDR